MENNNSNAGVSVQQSTPIKFTGTGSEYFKIWIVNIFLTIVTLGIYSAWAKVRTNQYFYSNTRLAGGVFNYHANPKTILIGRIIAVVYLGLYSFLAQSAPNIGVVMGLILFALIPWIAVKSLMFQARNTSYRNIRFDFEPAYGDAVMVFIVWPILIAFTAGLLLPVLWHRQVRLISNNMRFGTSPFRFNQQTAGPFFAVYFKMLGVGAVIVAALIVLNMTFPNIFRTAGVFVEQNQSLAYVVGVIVYLVVILLVNSYIMAKVTNLMYSKLSLEGHSFNSTLSTGGFFGQYFKHTIYTMLTLGLYIPYAKANIIKYRLDNLTVNIDGDLDAFIAKKVDQGSATGEGLGDMFEVEVGF